MTPKEAALIQYAHWMSDPKVMTGFILIGIWVAIWKGIALWKAAKNGSLPWFIALLVINTIGILEIVYIFFFSKKGEKNQ